MIRKQTPFLFSTMKRTPAFEDLDIMQFGKYKGQPLQDVPSSYLAWLRDTYEQEGVQKIVNTNNNFLIGKIKLYNYIMNSWDAIKSDLPDRIG